MRLEVETGGVRSRSAISGKMCISPRCMTLGVITPLCRTNASRYGPWLIWPTPGRYGPASQWIWPIFDITERFALIMPETQVFNIFQNENKHS